MTCHVVLSLRVLSWAVVTSSPSFCTSSWTKHLRRLRVFLLFCRDSFSNSTKHDLAFYSLTRLSPPSTSSFCFYFSFSFSPSLLLLLSFSPSPLPAILLLHRSSSAYRYRDTCRNNKVRHMWSSSVTLPALQRALGVVQRVFYAPPSDFVDTKNRTKKTTVALRRLPSLRNKSEDLKNTPRYPPNSCFRTRWVCPASSITCIVILVAPPEKVRG